MIPRLATALLLAVASLVLLGASPAHACRCAVGDVSRQADAADAVFVGSFPRSERVRDGGRITFRVAVREVYLGQVSEEMVVRAPYASATCGLEGIPAGRPVVWFTRGTGTEVRSDLCSGTATLDPDLTRRLERVIGAPVAPSASEGDTTSAASEPSPQGSASASPDSSGDRAEDTGGPFEDSLPGWAWGLVGLTAAAAAGAAVVAAAAARRRRAP